jgi:hypothetical protein
VYVRDYYVLNDNIDDELPESDPLRCPTCGLSHVTGRKCTRKGCKGVLKDTIINFGDMLDADQELPAMAAAEGVQIISLTAPFFSSYSPFFATRLRRHDLAGQQYVSDAGLRPHHAVETPGFPARNCQPTGPVCLALFFSFTQFPNRLLVLTARKALLRAVLGTQIPHSASLWHS